MGGPRPNVETARSIQHPGRYIDTGNGLSVDHVLCITGEEGDPVRGDDTPRNRGDQATETVPIIWALVVAQGLITVRSPAKTPGNQI